MSASDQDTPTADAPETEGPEEARKPEEAEKPEEAGEGRQAEGTREAEEGRGDTESPEVHEDSEESDGSAQATGEAARGEGLTPKQARRLRVAAASVLLVALAVVLVIRLASRTSVLVVGVYGLAMILCGIVIELSRNGRTRLGTWLLAGGLLTALALDWLVLP
ncbi:hypothetical protein [Streptomyces sp. NK15101]|uniref:hypothetical protein n=1 Tax=Streptomyces sp. NK15101 TaxID=2873261 RepID=UPI001CEDF830|nr:hypothetical protein [Streptomyces sp. NK15101]